MCEFVCLCVCVPALAAQIPTLLHFRHLHLLCPTHFILSCGNHSIFFSHYLPAAYRRWDTINKHLCLCSHLFTEMPKFLFLLLLDRKLKQEGEDSEGEQNTGNGLGQPRTPGLKPSVLSLDLSIQHHQFESYSDFEDKDEPDQKSAPKLVSAVTKWRNMNAKKLSGLMVSLPKELVLQQGPTQTSDVQDIRSHF